MVVFVVVVRGYGAGGDVAGLVFGLARVVECGEGEVAVGDGQEEGEVVVEEVGVDAV